MMSQFDYIKGVYKLLPPKKQKKFDKERNPKMKKSDEKVFNVIKEASKKGKIKQSLHKYNLKAKGLKVISEVLTDRFIPYDRHYYLEINGNYVYSNALCRPVYELLSKEYYKRKEQKSNSNIIKIIDRWCKK